MSVPTKFHILLLFLPIVSSILMTKPKGSPKVSMHWFRKGLRLSDNPALLAAIHNASRCFPLYVLDGDSYQLLRCTANRANFLLECLSDLDYRLQTVGSQLYVTKGDPTTELPKLWKEWGITHLYYEADETGEPYACQRDTTIQNLAKAQNVTVETFYQETLHPLKNYVDKAGKKPPGTMGVFTTLLATMPPIQPPKPPPVKGDFPKQPLQDHNNTYQLPKSILHLPWPRHTPRHLVTPIWGPAQSTHLTPLVHGGETLALQQLQQQITNRPSFTASFQKPDRKSHV